MTLPPDPAWEKTREKGSRRVRDSQPLWGVHNLLRSEGVGVAEENSLQMPELRSLQPHSPGSQMQPLSQSSPPGFQCGPNQQSPGGH